MSVLFSAHGIKRRMFPAAAFLCVFAALTECTALRKRRWVGHKAVNWDQARYRFVNVGNRRKQPLRIRVQLSSENVMYRARFNNLSGINDGNIFAVLCDYAKVVRNQQH